MSRKRRSGRNSRPLASPAQPPAWRWRTAPVFMAFSGGFLVCWFLYLFDTGITPGPFTSLLYWVMIVTFSFSASRISSQLVRQWMLRRTQRAEHKRAREQLIKDR